MAEHGAVIKHDQKKSPKTGAWRYMHPEVDKEKCIGCGSCVPFCPDACIEMKKYKEGQRDKPACNASRSDAGRADVDYEYCKGCGVCAEVCPIKAIIMKKK